VPSIFKIDIPACAKRLIRLLEDAGYEAFVVGGCVRDSLLGKEPHDWDICTSARPEEVCAILERNHIRTIETGLQHGTVTACYGMYNYEITTYRVDGEYSDNRRPDSVQFVVDVVEDLSRRDFTINAMAYSEADGLIDPWGGYGDLDKCLIHCVRNPDDRFREDALRIMRALRFASTYGFKIEEKTAKAIHRNKYLLKNISAERIRSELCKLLCGEGVLDILLEYKDVMAVIIPELEPCIGFDQNNPYHIYDVYDHIAHAVANYRGPDISIKMALLLHDIGKPECYTENEKGGHFHGHSVPSMRIAKDVVDRLKFDNKSKDEIVDLVMYHDSDIYAAERPVRRWLNKIGFEMLDKLICVKLADIGAHSEINQFDRIQRYYKIHGIAAKIMTEHQCFQIKDLAINGHDVMSLGVETGPKVGEVLNYILEKVIEEGIENDRCSLLEEVSRYLKGE
jgi:tRNA nucleotidyltransferase (CCA-adding enzyme)